MKLNKRDAAMLAAFAALILLFTFLTGSVSKDENEREIEMIRDAVKTAALTCYASQGYYPDDLEYLKDSFGLSYNEERYVVFYDAYASNLLPDIRVAERGQTAQ